MSNFHTQTDTEALAALEAQVGAEEEEVESEGDEEEDGEGGGLLSADTLAALKAFALDNGVFLGEGGAGGGGAGGGGAGVDVIDSVRKHFEVKEREDVFKIEYASKDGLREATYELKGIKRELSQTLDSTGLTMYVIRTYVHTYIRTYVHTYIRTCTMYVCVSVCLYDI
jgi:hypothetical protein